MCASRQPTVEKVQQLPQWPWSFTSLTTPRSRQSTCGGRLGCERGAEQGRQVRGQAGHATLQVEQHVSLAVVEKEGLVAGNHHLVQLLPGQHGAGRHGRCHRDGHDSSVWQDVGEVHGRQVLGVADALHHLQVVQGVHHNGLELGKLFGVDVTHKTVDVQHLLVDLAHEGVAPRDERVLRIFLAQLLSQLQRGLLVLALAHLVHKLLELLVLQHLGYARAAAPLRLLEDLDGVGDLVVRVVAMHHSAGAGASATLGLLAAAPLAALLVAALLLLEVFEVLQEGVGQGRHGALEGRGATARG
mmetsp:Transcript_117121/g.364702  ORF Transcript_117121/g.364702 Transcript_117121/m.364702 type:complete len:301 (+) Transcript_117121:750-1652(+)